MSDNEPSQFERWLDTCCVTGPDAGGHRELSTDLFASYRTFLAGAREQGLSVKAFGIALTQRQIRPSGLSPEGLQYRGPIRLRDRFPAQARSDSPTASPRAAVGDPMPQWPRDIPLPECPPWRTGFPSELRGSGRPFQPAPRSALHIIPLPPCPAGPVELSSLSPSEAVAAIRLILSLAAQPEGVKP